jgi:hypothetical protein
MMNARTTILLAFLGAACSAATPAVRPADRARPAPIDLADDVERQMLSDAGRHASFANSAREAGKADEAQAEDRAAADGYASFADRFPGSEWRLVARRSAAERFLLAGAPQRAAEEARKILADPQSDPASKAVGARLTAVAWQAVAVAETRAGKIEKLSLLTAAQRKDKPPRPRAPPEPWKRFIAAVDAYVPLAAQDPAQKLAAPDRKAAGALSAADLALIAAEVEYAHDNLEDARGRLDRVIAAWPSDAPVMENAVPLYLQTFLVLKDDHGYDTAVSRAKGLLDPEARRAREAASAPGATEDQKKASEILGRLGDQLAQQQQGAGFAQGERLLSAGKHAQAAEAFEKFAADNRDNPDAPNALYNAGIAWDKAKEPKKAAALRERLLKEYPDAKVAPQAMVAQASAFSRLGEHLAAQKLYSDYLTRWPQGEQRCLALYNRGVELGAAADDSEAAVAFVAFGTDDRCAKEDPKAAANMLYNAASIFQKAKRHDEAKSALKAMLALPLVNDAVVRSWIADAQRRLNAMK